MKVGEKIVYVATTAVTFLELFDRGSQLLNVHEEITSICNLLGVASLAAIVISAYIILKRRQSADMPFFPYTIRIAAGAILIVIPILGYFVLDHSCFCYTVQGQKYEVVITELRVPLASSNSSETLNEIISSEVTSRHRNAEVVYKNVTIPKFTKEGSNELKSIAGSFCNFNGMIVYGRLDSKGTEITGMRCYIDLKHLNWKAPLNKIDSLIISNRKDANFSESCNDTAIADYINAVIELSEQQNDVALKRLEALSKRPCIDQEALNSITLLKAKAYMQLKDTIEAIETLKVYEKSLASDDLGKLDAQAAINGIYSDSIIVIADEEKLHGFECSSLYYYSGEQNQECKDFSNSVIIRKNVHCPLHDEYSTFRIDLLTYPLVKGRYQLQVEIGICVDSIMESSGDFIKADVFWGYGRNQILCEKYFSFDTTTSINKLTLDFEVNGQSNNSTLPCSFVNSVPAQRTLLAQCYVTCSLFSLRKIDFAIKNVILLSKHSAPSGNAKTESKSLLKTF